MSDRQLRATRLPKDDSFGSRVRHARCWLFGHRLIITETHAHCTRLFGCRGSWGHE